MYLAITRNRQIWWVLYDTIPYPTSSVRFVGPSYQYPIVLWVLDYLYALTRQFCKICTKFVPVPRYYIYLCRNTWGSSVNSVHHTLPDKFCEFCKTFVPLPGSFVSSATNLPPYITYPYLTEHNLAIIEHSPPSINPACCRFTRISSQLDTHHKTCL